MNDFFTFQKIEKNYIDSITNTRVGEQKIGQSICFNTIEDSCRYAIIGICEDHGPQANNGNSGSHLAFHNFLSRFLNMQSNRYLNGKSFYLAGYIKQNVNFSDSSQNIDTIAILDELVQIQIDEIIKNKLIPIVIGGGHNNAYPIIKSYFENAGEKISVINLDPHADCRSTTKRHSGNPFSTAIEKKYIEKYTVIGLHKAYNNEFIYNFLENHQCHFTFFEDYILDENKFISDIENIANSTQKAFGLELDIDSIQNMPSSAFTPTGISILQARKYIMTFAKKQNCQYLHIPEAAPKTELEEKIIGKALAYFVWDFCYCNQLMK